MEQRGRKSAASLSLPIEVGNLLPRPDAPYDLTDEEATEWWAVVNRLPATWFPRETHGMLTNYCRHIVTTRRLSQLIQAAESQKSFNVREYESLLKMRERESRAASALATKMKFTQLSNYHESKKTEMMPLDPPWQKKAITND